MNPDNNNKVARIRIPKKKRPIMSFTNSYISDEDEGSSSFNNLQPNGIWKKIRRPSDNIEEETNPTPPITIEETHPNRTSIRDNYREIELSVDNTPATSIQSEEITSIESKIIENKLILDANEIDCFVQNYEYFKINHKSLKIRLDHSSSRIKPTGDTRDLYMSDENYRVYENYLSFNKNYNSFLAINEDKYFKITANKLKGMLDRKLTRKELSLMLHAMYFNNNYIGKQILEAFIDFYQKITGKLLSGDDTFILSKTNSITSFRIDHGDNFLRYITEVHPTLMQSDFASRKIFYNFKEIVFHVPNESDYGISNDIWILNELYFDFSSIKVANITYDDRNRNSIKKIFAGTINRLTTNKTWPEIISELSLDCINDSARRICIRARYLPSVLKALIASKESLHIYNLGNTSKGVKGNRSKFDENISTEVCEIIGNPRDMEIIRTSAKMKDIIKSIDNFEDKLAAMKKGRNCIQVCNSNPKKNVSVACSSFFEEYGDMPVPVASSPIRLRF